MEIKLWHVLVAAGVVGVGGYAAYRLIAKAPPTTGSLGTHQFLPPSLLPPPRGPGQIGVSQPVWDPESAAAAADIIAAVYEDMGNPDYDPQVVVELAFDAANELWPSWSWPTNEAQSALFLQSNDLGRGVWANLIYMAQQQVGYRPIT